MSGKKSDPPRLAIWLLRHACPASDNNALTGDLIERFHEGQSVGWLWRQVLSAFVVGVVCEIQRQWPIFFYAIGGTAMPMMLWKTRPYQLGFWLHWWSLPWPVSQLVLDWSPAALFALESLPALAVALVIDRSFRWISLLRTGVITLALFTANLYLFNLLYPWLTRPVPGDPYRRVLILPSALGMLLWVFITFVAAGWLGCRPSRHTSPTSKPVEDRVA
jgi:hypothetical protein